MAIDRLHRYRDSLSAAGWGALCHLYRELSGHRSDRSIPSDARRRAAAFNAEAVELAQSGSWREAADLLQRSVKLDPKPDTLIFLGNCLFNSSGDGYLSAEAAYRAAANAGNASAHHGLGECLTRRAKFDAACKAHDAYYRDWLNSERSASLRHRQAAARERKVPPIVLVAMQKSASEFIRENFLTSYEVPEIAVSIGSVPDDRAIPSALDQLAKGGALCRTHMGGNNAAALAKAGLNRILLHVRDPRQVTVSWAHMMARLSCQEFIYSAAMYHPHVPLDYQTWQFEKQLNWAIENYLPGQLAWLEGWIEALERHPELSVCITTFEEFRRDQGAFFGKAVDFFRLPELSSGKPTFDLHNEASMRNFRSGEIDEWKSAFTTAQRQSVRARVAPLAERFHW